MDVLKGMHDTFKSNPASAVTLERSVLESYTVFMKVNNDEHAKMKALIEDKKRLVAGDDESLSIAKTAEGDVETSKC